MEKILVTGASGLIGQQLCKLLSNNGFEVLVLSRREREHAQYKFYEWNLQKDYINEEVFEHKIDYVVHLAGAGIADKRWTDQRKKLIIDSRVDGVHLLAKYFKKHGQKPKAFISAAAVGIYGNAGSEAVDESTPIDKSSDAFLVESCVAWEGAAEVFKEMGVRTALLRIGIVLSTQGGALAKMLPTYSFWVGGYFGDGQQYYPWVHIDEIAKMFLFLVQNEDSEGVYNGVAPNAVPNKVLARKIADAKGQKALVMPIPAFAMRLALGEMADMVLYGANVKPTRLEAAGYEFEFPQLEAALKDVLARKI
jgi:uncharacterized protein (TIGR01777 family)